jgi:two-component system, cell cycle sensor histidine kinase and response regulator CckA
VSLPDSTGVEPARTATDAEGSDTRGAGLRDLLVQLEGALAAPGDGLCLLDWRWRFLHVNEAAAAMAGMRPEDLVGRDVIALFPQLQDSAVLQAWSDVASTRRPGRVGPIDFDVSPVGGLFEFLLWPLDDGLLLLARRYVDASGLGAELDRSREASLMALRLAAAVEQTSESVVVTDVEAGIVYVNPAFERVTGYSREDVVGRNPRILQSGVHTAEFYAEMWRTLVAGETWHGEIVNRAKDLTLFTEEASISPVRDASGTIVAYVAVKRDVTAERRAEQALRESEARLREVQQIAGVAGWELDARTGEVMWSDEMYVLYGRDPALGPLSSTAMAEAYGPGSRDRLEAAAAHTLATGEPFVVEIEVRRADGSVRSVEDRAEVVRDADGRIVGLRGTVVDLTERSRAERALHESEARYRSLFEGMQEGLAYCRMLYADGRPDDWVYLEVNDAFVQLTGLRDVVGRRASEVMPGIRESDSTLIATYGRVASGAGPERFEMYVAALEDWFSVSAYSPAPEHFIAVFDVITERKRSEERTLESARLEAMGRLAGGVAHDFNNLLTTIHLSTELLTSIDEGRPAATEEIVAIRDAADRAAALTRQLLALGRREVVTMGSVDLADVLAELSPMLHRTLGEDVELRPLAGGGARPIRADRAQMGQVVINLAFNARDAMPEGGTLTFEVAPVSVTEAWAGRTASLAPGAYTRLTVTDTGAGIPDPILERIFEPFFTTKAVGRGTGLGLSTVESIVSRSGGSIRVQSREGHGTTFEILLPCATEDEEEAELGTPAEALTGRGTILLVEDEAPVRAVTARMLRSLGYTVVEATRPSEALAIHSEGAVRFDLLVADVVMPGMTGMRLSAALTRREPRLPTLFVSGYAPDPSLMDRVRAPGAGFLAKPFSREQIATAVRRLLEPAGGSPGPTA